MNILAAILILMLLAVFGCFCLLVGLVIGVRLDPNSDKAGRDPDAKFDPDFHAPAPLSLYEEERRMGKW